MAQAEAGGAPSHLNHEIVASLDDFQDPSQEWRRLFSELLGTFFLVLVAAGGGMMGQAFPGMISRAAAVVAPGLMVMAVILFMGKVSGAHLNPAVSIAFSLRGDFPWRRVPGYIVAQLIGATLAALFLHAVINFIPEGSWDKEQTITIREGRANVFVAVEHANSEVIGIHASRSANRFEALEPVRQGVHRCFGAIAPQHPDYIVGR